MYNPLIVFIVVFAFLAGLFLLPFPVFIVLAIIGGAIAGWIYGGRKIQYEESHEEEEYREYEEWKNEEEYRRFKE